MYEQQTRLESLLERIVDMTSGVLLAYLAWMFLVPVIWPQYDPPAGEGLALTLLFTAISFFRGLFWRRFFANGIHRVIHQMVIKRYGLEKAGS